MPTRTARARPPFRARAAAWARARVDRVRRHFVEEEPTFWVALLPMLALAAVLYTRSPATNFIFDEQEALLANPYVNGTSLRFVDVVHRDFWGLGPERSIGSYRPLPNVVWRSLATLLRTTHDLVARVGGTKNAFSIHPWVFHWLNVVFHAANGALLAATVWAVGRRRDVAWLAGAAFVAAAVVTEAVCGVVGIADVLGGLGAVLALAALRLPIAWMPLGVAGGIAVGLWSKESAIVCVPLVPLAALLIAPATHPRRPMRVLRALAAAVASLAVLVAYVETRRRWFPTALPAALAEPLPPDAGAPAHWMRAFLVWFHQPSLPVDRINNPLVDADSAHRVAGALRVYWRGLVQVVFPHTLSGDYSFPQEPIPAKVVFPESVLGALATVLPPIAAAGIWIRASIRDRRARAAGETPPAQGVALLGAVGLVWLVVSYFPHSNIPVVLPTVRAERFWYFPIVGTSVLVGWALAWVFQRTRGAWRGAPAIALASFFFVFQATKARLHALDYADDLVFWRATRDAVPRSAKAHLNYSVMWGARNRLDIRLEENRIAADLAPEWPMAHIYLGDTLCRMHRADEAWPHYARGFAIGHGDPNLCALALQCLWDESAFPARQEELLALADKYPSSWLAFLVRDIVANGTKNHGVDPKHRPRGYNEGPKE